MEWTLGILGLLVGGVVGAVIAWLWERWIPSRMLTLLGGYGGDGKSTVMASLIGLWTTGRALPGGPAMAPINVLMLSAEDDVAYALRPRLDLHGADPKRVLCIAAEVLPISTLIHPPHERPAHEPRNCRYREESENSVRTSIQIGSVA